ncbi:glycine betaine ABC transporter substrate-binding protein [Litoreibacter roseus]|uniref:Glycine/betaine ABC transporter n=1 Tax=Litoreibacter roseus TaxID=2601869 RepID=A0A6N6JCX1_9RHOB|nr:glycine betaine ABC transporter substrate-binding protein [Litoreibacter roseus]GFE63269.1 glycine/betaine ABC transporter [Litoreibacter roseus]
MTNAFRQTTFATAMLAATVLPNQMRAASDDQDTIVLGQVGLSFYAVVGGVVQEVLEQEGYTVDVVEGPHDEIFPQLGAGDVDMLAAAWLPSAHGTLYEPVEDVTFEIAPIYEEAKFFWAVPSYIPESVLSSVADLTKPKVAAIMPNTIISLPEATGLTTGARRVMEAYGLEDAGYELIAAEPSEWLDTFRTAVEKKEWVVLPLWQPQWINAVYDIRPLTEPKNAYGDPDTAYLIGHEQLRDKLSAETMQLLQGIRFDVADVTEMDRLMNVDGMSAREAAQSWMAANTDIVESWSTN